MWFQNWDQDDGLPTGNVPVITKDSKGFLWLGTLDGLVRFDGHKFLTLRYDYEEQTPLLSNQLDGGVVEGPGYKIWVASRAGLSVIDPVTMKVIKNPNSLKGKIPDFLGRAGDIMVVKAEKSLFFYDGSANLLSKKDEILSKQFTLLNEKLAVGAFPERIEFYRVDIDQKNIFKDTTAFRIDKEKSARYIRYYDDSTLVRVTGKGELWLDRFYIIEERMQSTFIGDGFEVSNQARSLLPLATEKDGSFWYHKAGRLVFFQNVNKGSLTFHEVEIRSDQSKEYSLKATGFVTIMKDEDGLLWIGDNVMGLSMLDTRQLVFKAVNQKNLGLRNIQRNLLWHFTQDEAGDLYLAGDHGMVKLHVNTDEDFYSFPFLQSIISDVQRFPNQNTSGIRKTINAFQDGQKTYYNVFREGIFKVIGDRVIKIFPNQNQGVDMTRITAYDQLDEETIIWGTHGALIKHTTTNDKFEIIPLRKDSLGTGYSVLGLQVIGNREEDWRAWIGVRDGVMHYTKISGKSWFFDHDSTGNFPLKGTDVMAIEESADSVLWVGTLNGGVASKNLQTGDITYFNESNGLANDQIFGLLIDHKNRVWVSHNRGISCISPVNNEILNFSMAEGTRMNEFSQNGYSKVDDYVFFAGINGGIVFHPDSVLNAYKNHKKMQFTKLQHNRIDPNKTNDRFYIPQEEINIHYENRDFELGISDMTFTKKNRRYSYRIQGDRNNWQEISPDLMTIFVNNLGIGRHVFEVRRTNGAREWKKPELSLSVNIIPPFWLTNWFIVLLTVLGLSGFTFISYKITGFYYRSRIQKLESDKKVQAERERLSRDLHDSLGTQLSIILRHLEHVEPSVSGESTTRLTAAKKTAHHTIRQMRESLWALKKEKIHLSAFTDRMKELAKRSLEGTGIILRDDINIRRDIRIEPIEMLHILRIVHEAVGNAIKYSEAQTLTLKVISELRGGWSICVSDDGVGFNLDKVYGDESYGLTHMYKRAEEINAKVEIRSTPEAGTKICVMMNGA